MKNRSRGKVLNRLARGGGSMVGVGVGVRAREAATRWHPQPYYLRVQ